MVKILLTAALLVATTSTSFAQNYMGYNRPMYPVYNYIPTPEVPGMPYTPPFYPTEIPVAVSPNRQCAMYVDPYDLFGQIFGGADLVQSCWVPLQ